MKRWLKVNIIGRVGMGLLCLALLTGCQPNFLSMFNGIISDATPKYSDDLYQAIDSGNLEWVREEADGVDLDHIYTSKTIPYTTSALIVAMTGEWSFAWNGPTDIFTFLLDAGANPNSTESTGRTPFLSAVNFSDPVAIQYLDAVIGAGANLEQVDAQGKSLLDLAVHRELYDSAKYLLEHDLKPSDNLLASLGENLGDSGHSARGAYSFLHVLLSEYSLNSSRIPASIQTVLRGEPLIDFEAVRALSDEDFRWLLFCLAALDSPGTLEKCLLERPYDAYRDMTDVDGKTLPEVAAENENLDMLAFLLAQAGVMTEERIDSLYLAATGHNNPELLALLQGHTPKPTPDGVYNCINVSIEAGTLEDLRYLLTRFEDSPGIYAAQAGRCKSLSAMELLVELGLTQQDISSSLSFAAAYGAEDVVRFLLESGADPNHKELTYGTPLLVAAQHGYLSIVDLLLDSGADPKQVNWSDEENLLISAAFGSSRILERLIKAGAEVNYQEKSGATPLHYAVANNRIDNVVLLINAGADTSIKDEDGETALSIAKEEGYNDIVLALLNVG